jgi:hypothetical protein
MASRRALTARRQSGRRRQAGSLSAIHSMRRSLRGVAARATEPVDGHLTQCGDPQAVNHLDDVEDNVYVPEVSVTLASLLAGGTPSASALPAMSRT